MRAEGTHRFAARRDVVYRALNDPERLASLVPGVERVEIHDERHWSVEARFPLGPVKVRLAMRFLREQERPPEHARLSGSGHTSGTSLAVDTTFLLAEYGDGTEMSWHAEAHVGGAMGRLGSVVLGSAFEHQIARVLTALDRELASA